MFWEGTRCENPFHIPPECLALNVSLIEQCINNPPGIALSSDPLYPCNWLAGIVSDSVFVI